MLSVYQEKKSSVEQGFRVWSAGKSQMSIDSIKAVLLQQVNVCTCSVFHEKLVQNITLPAKILHSEKYVLGAAESEAGICDISAC